MRWSYSCPLDEAAILAVFWTVGPYTHKIAQDLLAARMDLPMTWTRRALRGLR